MDYYADCRNAFTLGEWMELLVSSMGFNPPLYSPRQKLLLIARLVPLVEPRVNLVELASKGTGKSFVYDNLSRYARAISGGKVTPPVLFHNNQTNTPGLITRYDLVVLDEVQSVQGDSAGELIAGLKVYLESGRFSRGNTQGTAEAGFVMMGNITLDEFHRPAHEGEGIFREIPNFLQETAFIDRLHGLVPGWEMPRISKDTPSSCLGFKGDFFSEVLHALRSDVRFADFASASLVLRGCSDMRDSKAIVRVATGLLKLLFPNRAPSEAEFLDYCARPAVELRQRIRDELHKMDAEYQPVTIAAVEA